MIAGYLWEGREKHKAMERHGAKCKARVSAVSRATRHFIAF